MQNTKEILRDKLLKWIYTCKSNGLLGQNVDLPLPIPLLNMTFFTILPFQNLDQFKSLGKNYIEVNFFFFHFSLKLKNDMFNHYWQIASLVKCYIIVLPKHMNN